MTHLLEAIVLYIYCQEDRMGPVEGSNTTEKCRRRNGTSTE